MALLQQLKLLKQERGIYDEKSFYPISGVALFTSIIYAQAATTTTQQQPVKGFEGVRRYVEEKELVIEIKALIPSTDIFQDKSDTLSEGRGI